MNLVTPDQARDFYRAAASFYRQAPWRAVGSDEPIQVEVRAPRRRSPVRHRPGEEGQDQGPLALRRLEDLLALRAGRLPDRRRPSPVHRPSLRGSHGDQPGRSGDRPSGSASRSPVPEPTPPLFRKERGGDFRSPEAGELELLEACLWVLPDFLKRAEDRKPDVYEYAFKGMAGKMTLDLSWVPKKRLEVNRPEGSA